MKFDGKETSIKDRFNGDAGINGYDGWKSKLLIVGVSVIGIVILIVILTAGERLQLHVDKDPGTLDQPTPQDVNTLFHVLLAMGVIIVIARLMGLLLGKLDQPAVIGEVVGGIFLGPSVLGKIAPNIYAQLLPITVAPFINVIAQLGIVMYMFLVGLSLDLTLIKEKRHVTVLIAMASICAPFLLGAGASLGLYSNYATPQTHFTVFALFLGLSLSVTAFPVLARILTDLHINKSWIGSLSLTCAAIGDVAAWCLLAFVVSVAQEQMAKAVKTIILTVIFLLVIFKVVKPLMHEVLRRLENSKHLTRNDLAIIFVAMIVSATASEFIGIHAIFGAFLLGAIMPAGSSMAADLSKRLEDFISVIFLPAFFAYTGMRTHIGLLTGWSNWSICLAIIGIACIGKFGGTYLSARFTGLNQQDSAALGVLMNTRGMVELILLNIGLDLHIISPTLFVMLMLMTLVTTFLTTPILKLILRRHRELLNPA